MLFQEPIVSPHHVEFPQNTPKTDMRKLLAMTLYSSLLYSILYLIFFAYPYSVQVVRGWKSGIASLPFLGIFVSILICSIYMAINTKTRFQRELICSRKPVLPEARLPPMIIGSFILPAGLFWFARTSDPNITWVPQVLSGVFIGCGIFLVFFRSLSSILQCSLYWLFSFFKKFLHPSNYHAQVCREEVNTSLFTLLGFNTILTNPE
jgi:hypothetical protein